MNTFPPLLRATVPLLLLSLSAARAIAAPVQVDPAALVLLQKVQTATQNMRSISADFETDMTITDIWRTPQSKPKEIPFRMIGNFRAMKPNYLREQRWNLEKNNATGLWEKPKTPLTTASNGHKTWRQVGADQYTEDEADPQGHNLYAALPSEDFFDASKSVLAQVRRQQEKGQLYR